jgi:GMP reductase
MIEDFSPSYDNIYLRPRFSSLLHRADADTSVDFLGRKFNLPVIPANMEDVIGFQNAEWLAKNGYFYIMHRFKGAPSKFVEFSIAENLPYISISIGVGEDSKKELGDILTRFGDVLDYLTIDVAHGHHQNVEDMMSFIWKQFEEDANRRPAIIAGNVATQDGYEFLCDLGVDAVKIGIGGGSICTTRFETGFHLPTATSLLECQYGKKKPIIADGGIKHHGDIAKAIALGADMIMCGGLFASCIDSPAQIVHGKKIYRGSTSYAAKGHDNHVEGKTIELEGDITYEKRMEKIQQALRSSISYAGGKDLSSFKNIGWHYCL